MTQQDDAGKAARTAMAKLSGTDLAGYDAQLATTAMYYKPAAAVTFGDSADLIKTMDLVRESRFKNSFIFKYSPRPGTKADDLYPDGLQRQNLLPTIALLKQWLGPRKYRMTVPQWEFRDGGRYRVPCAFPPGRSVLHAAGQPSRRASGSCRRHGTCCSRTLRRGRRVLVPGWGGSQRLARTTTVGFATGAMVNYSLNLRFTFKRTRPHREALPRFLAVAAAGMLLNSGVFALGSGVLGLHYMIAQVCATAAVVVCTFLANRLWTFQERKP
jgi:putative flippase GtrA